MEYHVWTINIESTLQCFRWCTMYGKFTLRLHYIVLVEHRVWKINIESTMYCFRWSTMYGQLTLSLHCSVLGGALCMENLHWHYIILFLMERRVWKINIGSIMYCLRWSTMYGKLTLSLQCIVLGGAPCMEHLHWVYIVVFWFNIIQLPCAVCMLS